MVPIILYTKKFELNFDNNNVAQIDLSPIIEELSKEYTLLDNAPSITVENGFQYVTVKLVKKEDRKKIGF
jgi:hypothetical protein